MKMNEEIFWEIQRTLGWEFDRYALSHPAISIPRNALISFRIKGNSAFNKWSKEISCKLRENKQPILIVETEGLSPPPPVASRLINPHLEVITK